MSVVLDVSRKDSVPEIRSDEESVIAIEDDIIIFSEGQLKCLYQELKGRFSAKESVNDQRA